MTFVDQSVTRTGGQNQVMLLSRFQDGLVSIRGLRDSLRPGEFIGVQPVIAVDGNSIPRLQEGQLAARQLVAVDIVQVEANDILSEKTGVAPTGANPQGFDRALPLTE